MNKLIRDYNWNKQKILVVEDDESSAYLLGEILKETGAKIDYTTDGDEAVEFMRNHPETDLILMDIHLPEKDGFTATREIKVLCQQCGGNCPDCLCIFGGPPCRLKRQVVMPFSPSH